MLAQQVAKKYSTALFNIVQEKGLVDQAFEQFEQLDNLIKSDDMLLQFLLLKAFPINSANQPIASDLMCFGRGGVDEP